MKRLKLNRSDFARVNHPAGRARNAKHSAVFD